MTCKNQLAAMIVLLLLGIRPAMAAIRLGAPFGEHMVLQQGVPVPIWGTGCPGGDTVRLYIAGQNVATTCDWQGRWLVILAPMKAGGPYQLLIEIGGLGRLIPSPAANSRGGVELNDVVVGEVWVAPWQFAPASGATKNGKNGASETAVAPSAWIRVFKPPVRTADGPQPAARWTVALPGSPGIYSGASYLFARELYNKLGVPIGVIENSAGP